MTIAHDDPRLSWHGHISLERTDQYTRPWRLPFEQKILFFPALADVAATQAGVRLAFHSDTRRIAGRTIPFEKPRKIDLCIDGEYFATRDFSTTGQFAFDGLPDGPKLLELWLPQRSDFAVEEIEIDDGSSLRPSVDNRPRWMTYGSSITHCDQASSPAFTWPSIVARACNLHLTCLGYGGQEHLDTVVARFMRDRPADYISLKVGINVWGGGTLNARTFGPSIIGFVQILREKHPETPIALISPIYCAHHDTAPNCVGMTLQDYRNAVREAADILRQSGDRNILYIDGLDLFGENLAHLMPDQVHPNAEGYRLMAKNFLQVAAPRLFGMNHVSGTARAPVRPTAGEDNEQ